eukprot:scaffold51039_cov65-Phaeocystis_antarctica.AAC.4
MHRQLKAGRRVCRRELLEASAQPTAFSSDEREQQPLLSGAFTGGDANAAVPCGMPHSSLLKATPGMGAMAASATISVTTCACHTLIRS